MRANLSIPVTSGQNVVHEYFTWTFSDGRPDNVSDYPAGQVTVATESTGPNTSGSLTLASLFADGTTQSVTKFYTVGEAPNTPPPPPANEPSTLGEFVIEWVEE